MNRARYLLPLVLALPAMAHADAVVEWNRFACDLVGTAKMVPPPANRAMAIMHTAIHEATQAAMRSEADGADARVSAAVAAASHASLETLLPAHEAQIDAHYAQAIAALPDDASRKEGIALGLEAARAVIERRRADGADAGESYQPHTAPGVYVPTMVPAVTHWPGRKPWLMERANQFRPGPPPDLKSEQWARDYNEIKQVGGRKSTHRTPEQTAVATFWEATLPAVYFGLVRGVAERPGRTVADNARLYMAASQAMDDALIAVFDAKYHYNFWRPITAIRNGDRDGNDATEREANWVPFIDTPMHPEYPCAHCVVAGAVGTVLKADLGEDLVPALETTSYTAKDVKRAWKTLDDFMVEVAEARIYDGVHFRSSTQAGLEIGRKVGELAARTHFEAAR